MTNSKRIIMVVALIIGFLLITTSFIYSNYYKHIKLDVDGKVVTALVNTNATVGQILKKEDVTTTNAIVTPALKKAPHDAAKIKVRYLKPLSVVVDGTVEERTVTAPTINEALDTLEVSHDKKTYLSHSPTTHIPTKGFDKPLVVSNEKDLTVIAAGKASDVVTNAPTVAKALVQADVEVTPTDEVSEELSSYTTPNMAIKVVDITTKNLVKNVKTKPKVIVKKDKSLISGVTKVIEAGKPALTKRTIKVTYADGKVRHKKITNEKSITRGSHRVIAKGTRVPPKRTSPKRSSNVVHSAPTGGGCAGWGASLNKYFGSQAGKACQVMRCESGGNPHAQNPSSTASGLFQFLDSTWKSARLAIPGGSKYARAMNAPGDLQVKAAASWLARTNWSQWSCA